MSSSQTVEAGRSEVADETERLRMAIGRLARLMRQNAGGQLTPTQHSALATIYREGPVTPGRISEVENVAPPSVTNVVAKLETLGLVERTPDEIDRRTSRIAITDKGRTELANTRLQKHSWFESRMAQLDDRRRRELFRALDALEALIPSSSK